MTSKQVEVSFLKKKLVFILQLPDFHLLGLYQREASGDALSLLLPTSKHEQNAHFRFGDLSVTFPKS